jgi:hypothetical protein
LLKATTPKPSKEAKTMTPTAEFHAIQDGTRERMLRELASDLADLVSTGDLTDLEANEWYNMKADQWAEGLS